MTPTLVDAAVAITLALSTLLAWSRGFTRESLSIIGWLIAILLARQFAYLAVPIIEGIPQIKKYVEDCQILTAAAFALVFIVAMVTMAILTPLFSGMIQNSFFSAFDSGLGAAFGFIRGVIIVLLVLFLYDKFVKPSSPISIIEGSRTYAMLEPSQAQIATDVEENTSGMTRWITRQFDIITRNCPADSEEAVGVN